MNTQDPIVKIRYFSTPLSKWQVGFADASHSFIVMETRDWYWSMEKVTDAIIVQRSRECDKVLLYQRGEKRETRWLWGWSRPSLFFERNPSITKTTGDIVYCLWTAIFEKYNLLTSNCKQFSDKLFEEVYPGWSQEAWQERLDDRDL